MQEQDIRRTSEYQQWRRDVKRRDGGACRVCEEHGNSHAHHIKPLEKYPDLATEIDNGITLCGNCHMRLKGKEESTNLQTVIEVVTRKPDARIADQLKRLNSKFCDYLINLLKSEHQATRLNAAFQLLNHFQIYPDSVEQFLLFIQHLLNEENVSDEGLAEQIVVEFFERNPSGVTSQVLRKRERRIEAEKHERGTEPEELKRLLRRAEQGDASAQFLLGVKYYFGGGVEQDDVEAVKWCRKAADQGYADAQYALGWRSQYAKYVVQNYAEAVKWYRKAAEQGHKDAQYHLGVMYENGWGVEQDRKEAVKWFQKAVEQGHTEAQNNLRR